MADENKEPRRCKLPSEYTDDDRASTRRLGGGGRRPERDEYVKWRSRMLSEERDDLELRGRLLSEQAEVLRTRASDQESEALERLTTEDHHDHLTASQAAREEGADAPRLDDGGASKLEQQAEQLEDEAQEIADHFAQEVTTT